MIDERCFARASHRGCRALNTDCPGYEKCAFYKPRWRQEKEVQLVKYRLASLPLPKQLAIADKYFEGKMIWAGVKG